MNEIETITVNGKSGKTYNLTVCPVNTLFTSAGGVYIFIRRDMMGEHLIYCGKAEDMPIFFDNHDKYDCIKNNGTTHICILEISDEEERDYIKKDILSANHFSCS